MGMFFAFNIFIWYKPHKAESSPVNIKQDFFEEVIKLGAVPASRVFPSTK